MSFFYDLNKRLAALASKQDAQQIAEEATTTAPKSKLAESIEVAERSTGDYSAKKARAGKDIGKPGKAFAKIAQSAGAKYGSKERGEKVAGAVLAKLRKPTEEGVDKAAFAKLAPPTDKITFADKIAGAKKEVDEMLGDVAADAMRKAITTRGGEVTKTSKGIKHRSTDAYGGTKDEPHALDRLKGPKMADEGNAFTGKLKSTPKGGKFKLGNKEFTDTSEVDEGYAEMDAWLKQREKEKGTGKFDVKDTGYSKRYTRKEEPEASDDEETSTEPKRRGRPKGAPKGPERVTAKSYKYKAGRPAKTNEGDNCCPHCGESLEVDEVAPPGAKAERMVKHIKKAYSKDGKLTPKEKSIAYATTWKAKKAGQVEEESTDKEDTKAEKAGKKVAKDIEHDEGNKSKGDNKAEKAGKKVTKDIEYDDKKDKKEEKVDETTVAGSVATSTAAPKASKGMQFGKGVYESFNNSIEKMITESVDIAETVSEMEGEGKTVTVTASGLEADVLMQLLKAAGLSGQDSGCGCGQTPCGCKQVDENSPDWPTNTETSNDALQYAGGLNKPKATKQGTLTGGGLPTMSPSRQVSMEESVELERTLFDTWKNYKG